MSLAHQAAQNLALKKALPSPAEARTIRETVGVTQADVARELGVAVATVSRWESGRRTPSKRLLKRYSVLLSQLQNVA